MRVVSIMRVGALALALTAPALSMAYAGGDSPIGERVVQQQVEANELALARHGQPSQTAKAPAAQVQNSGLSKSN